MRSVCIVCPRKGGWWMNKHCELSIQVHVIIWVTDIFHPHIFPGWVGQAVLSGYQYLLFLWVSWNNVMNTEKCLDESTKSTRIPSPSWILGWISSIIAANTFGSQLLILYLTLMFMMREATEYQRYFIYFCWQYGFENHHWRCEEAKVSFGGRRTHSDTNLLKYWSEVIKPQTDIGFAAKIKVFTHIQLVLSRIKAYF